MHNNDKQIIIKYSYSGNFSFSYVQNITKGPKLSNPTPTPF